MASLNSAVNIGMTEFMAIASHGKSFENYPYLAKSTTALLDALTW